MKEEGRKEKRKRWMNDEKEGKEGRNKGMERKIRHEGAMAVSRKGKKELKERKEEKLMNGG